jgi:hypothetical protein
MGGLIPYILWRARAFVASLGIGERLSARYIRSLSICYYGQGAPHKSAWAYMHIISSLSKKYITRVFDSKSAAPQGGHVSGVLC